jgi:hypothetical protein
MILKPLVCEEHEQLYLPGYFKAEGASEQPVSSSVSEHGIINQRSGYSVRKARGTTGLELPPATPSIFLERTVVHAR